MRRLTVISLGGGVQSSIMALMASEGAFDATPDCATFADTHWEPPSVYEHLEWLKGRLRNCSDSMRSEWGGQREEPLWQRIWGLAPSFQGTGGWEPRLLPHQHYAVEKNPPSLNSYNPTRIVLCYHTCRSKRHGHNTHNPDPWRSRPSR